MKGGGRSDVRTAHATGTWFYH